MLYERSRFECLFPVETGHHHGVAVGADIVDRLPDFGLEGGQIFTLVLVGVL